MANLAQDAILNSFIKLLSEKSFDKITVKDIIDDCQIARRTFYYHYQDLYAVVEDLLRQEVEKALNTFRKCGNVEESFISASRFILDNKSAVYHLYNSVHRNEIVKYINKIASEIIVRYIDVISHGRVINEKDKNLIITFYKCALTGILLDWLENGMKSDPESGIRRLGYLFDESIEKTIDKSCEDNEKSI